MRATSNPCRWHGVGRCHTADASPCRQLDVLCRRHFIDLGADPSGGEIYGRGDEYRNDLNLFNNCVSYWYSYSGSVKCVDNIGEPSLRGSKDRDWTKLSGGLGSNGGCRFALLV